MPPVTPAAATAAAPAPASPSPWKTDSTHVSIKAPGGGHWRAGHQFGRDATVMAKADLTASQAEMILGDPKLAVTEVADPAASPAAAPAATK